MQHERPLSFFRTRNLRARYVLHTCTGCFFSFNSSPIRRASKQTHPKAGHPRYNIFIWGCSPTVYRGIIVLVGAQERYAKFLGTRDSMGGHPRLKQETLTSDHCSAHETVSGGWRRLIPLVDEPCLRGTQSDEDPIYNGTDTLRMRQPGRAYFQLISNDNYVM